MKIHLLVHLAINALTLLSGATQKKSTTFLIFQLLGFGVSFLVGHLQCCVTLGKVLSFSGSLFLTYKKMEWTLMNPKALSNSDIPSDIPFIVMAEGQKGGSCTAPPCLGLGFSHSQWLLTHSFTTLQATACS